MGYFAGIDLGKRKSQIKVIGSDREVVEELKVDNNPRSFERVFKKYKGDIEVACRLERKAGIGSQSRGEEARTPDSGRIAIRSDKERLPGR